MRKTFLLIAARLLAFFSCCLFVEPVHTQPTISYQSTVTGLTAPIDVADAKDGFRPFIYSSAEWNHQSMEWKRFATHVVPFND